MISYLPPALIFILGAALIPLLQGRTRQVYVVFLPLLGLLNLMALPEGATWVFNFMNYELILCRVDNLTMVFAYIFVIMTLAGAIFALHLKQPGELVAGFLYAGSSLGVVFAGDLFSLFIYWEVMALASVMLIIARKTKGASAAGGRYIMVHLFGGLLLFAGIVMHITETGSMAFDFIGLSGLASSLILAGFALNAAIPPLSAWLSDAYPESTVVGTVFLSAFTTKTAVYVLARGFPGTELLMWAGAIMTLYGIVYAILENDMRRVLAYSIINQVGFMITGIGIGTALALNGAASHAFAHILYKALLMMSAGAVLYMTGKSKCTELGGLYKSMPITMILCCVGAASISSFPLTGGFTTKSMIVSAAGYEHFTAIWLILMVASAGVFLHAGIKFPYFVFFAKDSGLRPKEPPLNMLVAMGFLAFLCIAVGVYPQPLYTLLPYPVDYVAYTGDHVVGQLQILFFSALAFFMLLKWLKRTETISLDTDWVYRRALPALLSLIGPPAATVSNRVGVFFIETIPKALVWFGQNPTGITKVALYRTFIAGRTRTSKAASDRELALIRKNGPSLVLRPWSIGSAIAFVTLFLGLYLIFYYLF
ncbi:MAG: Na(+)/H(+) antiporter subunit D [Eubacteriales bacterium]|nr:Na(+)/H(+) antiporter subunit D [Bacillota bacterium]MDZ4042005.1 Na(+)/H(+) antiporter subunit D [Eubacteriales bacterium]MDZ7609131.1 Na(+)/H(+) antiporter subunit D [Eubacteriales bacterium]